MGIKRRDFLKMSGATVAAAAFGGLGFSLKPTEAKAQLSELRKGKETTSICCYCAVGCGLIVSTDEKTKRSTNVEGDPDHPINEGALCAKGASTWQLANNDRRPATPLYRAPGAKEFKEVSWEWAYEEIAKRVKKVRDESFQLKDAKGQTVNRTEALASCGSAALDNEECWAYQAMMRALGLVYIEHQARICHSSTVAALAESFGRGAMTNHWIDIQNSDVVLIMGSNAAECHPISFKWVNRAIEKGATLIHVDPRYTRTAAKAHIFGQIRSGTDIAVLGGMIKYILDNDLIQKDYVVDYTNASFIVGEKYGFKDGIFSGFNPEKQSYDQSQWAFEMDENGVPKKDPSLKNPRCVYQLLKKHYERYDLDKVSASSGLDKAKLEEIYKVYAGTGKADKSGTIMYAMGWTQHTVGVQYIRTMAMVQLLLGNIGVSGGGVNALRGESNVQGSTDHCLLYHILPGYLSTPKAGQETLADYNKAYTPISNDPKSANWWQNYPKYSASLIKAMYQDSDPAEAYSYLPKLDNGSAKVYSWLPLWDKMHDGQFKGAFIWGMNPACGGANAGKNREAMAKLDWMVNVNIFPNETGWFWEGPGMDPAKVKTEVFFLPCVVAIEKEGSITNSGRWMQWRYKGPDAPGDQKPDGDIMYELMHEIQKMYAKEGGAYPEAVTKLTWDAIASKGVFDAHKTAKLINGFFTKDTEIKGTVYKKGSQVPSFAFLQDDGSTTSGNWLYCNSYTDKGNMAAKRDPAQTPEQANIGLYPNWSWCWPVNRRILYNRASVDAKGNPWAPQKAVIKWTGPETKWVGDVPDGGWAPGDKHAFIMRKHGYGQIYGPGRVDGPFPEHYEPMECPQKTHPFSGTLHNPTALSFPDEAKAVADPKYPCVATTYRVTEHWQTGLMTRNQPWLVEAEPQMFVEMSPDLAKLRGIANGEKVMVESIRGSIWAIAMVTERMVPFTIQGQTVHQVGMPWQFGWTWPEDGGDSANLLSPSVGDPNTGIPETKAFMVNVRKA